MTGMRFNILILSFLIPLSVHGQIQDIPNSFRHYTTENGLSHNWAYCFLEDDKGFIWIGTRDGMNRFDGYEFKVYDESNTNLTGSHITVLHRGKNNVFWAGTQSSGLYMYSWLEDEFVTVDLNTGDNSSSFNSRIASITESNDGLLWIGTNGGGLKSVDPLTLEVKSYDLIPECNRIMALDADQDGNIWIGSFEGIYCLNRSAIGDHNLTRFKSEQPEYGEDRILSLHRDILGRLWVGTNGSGLFYFDPESSFLKRLQIDIPELTVSSIRKINSLPDGRILIGTANFGVVVIDPVTSETYSIDFDPDNTQSLINNSVYDILIDRFGSLWIANATGGVNYYNPYDRKFTTITHIQYKPNGLSNGNVRSFYEDRHGNIWIGTRSGLNLQLKGNEGFKTYNLGEREVGSTADLVILTMLDDSKGRFWVGCFSGGVKILDRNSGRYRQFSHSEDTNNTLDQAHVYDLLEDSRKNTWLATMGGVYLIDPSGMHLKRFTIANSNINHNSTRVLLEDSHGRIWLGTRLGLNYYNTETEEFESIHFENDTLEEEMNVQILCLYENNNGYIWAGTEGGGLKIINIDNSSFRSVGTESGFPDKTINAIEKDNEGNFWISTNKGLCKYDENSGQVIVFTREDGLQANDFYPNASLHSRSGDLYFGGPKGMNRFNPASININPEVPGIVFTKLFLKNQEVSLASEGTPLEKPLPLTHELILNHDQASFSIHFAGLGFINPEKYHYSYYLEGFEENWSPFGKQRTATYTNLDHGRYILKVKLMNNDKQVGDQIAEMNIRILPAPWVTWWAYLIYITILGGLLLLFRYYILSWAKVTNELEFEKREKEQIKELNQMKLRFFTNVSHEFRTPLTLLRGYIEKLSPVIKERGSAFALEQIKRNSKRLLTLVDELMDFRKAESGLLKLRASEGDLVKYAREIKEEFNEIAEQQNIGYTFTSELKSVPVWFDPGKIEKVLFNLISNAFKFTKQGGSVAVTISGVLALSGKNLKKGRLGLGKTSEWIEITVTDEGKGIPERDLAFIFERFFQAGEEDEESSAGTGIGLALCQRLVEIHKGRLLVNSTEGKGSSFTVSLPLGNKHLKEDEIIESERERFYLRLDYKSILSETFSTHDHPETDMDEIPGKPRVLIIEDNTQILNLLKDILTGDFNVFFTFEGKSGIEMAHDQHPDIVIADIMMPGMSGIDVCESLKCNPATSHIPVILLTAKSEEESQLDGLITGADAYITKPFSTKILIATIDSILVNRQKLREKFAAMDTIAPSDLTRNKIDEHFLSKVINLIEKNLSNSSLDVTHLCNELGVSRSVLYRKIKSLTDHSIQEFIRGVRLRKAKYILSNTDKSISEVSYLVGFSNTKHFSTSFRKEFDISPSEFRK